LAAKNPILFQEIAKNVSFLAVQPPDQHSEE
jgi:hypothetical protein